MLQHVYVPQGEETNNHSGINATSKIENCCSLELQLLLSTSPYIPKLDLPPLPHTPLWPGA
jgi:hypothetical protein